MVEPLISMELEGDEQKGKERKDKEEDDVVEEVRGGAAEEGASKGTKEVDSSNLVPQYSNFDAEEFALVS